MKRIFPSLVVLLLVGAGCISIVEPGEDLSPESTEVAAVQENTPVMTDELKQLLLVACRETAGDYDETTLTCTCESGAVLDEDSGECLAANGTPAGIRGQEILERQARQAACVDSSGSFDTEAQTCTCPAGQEAAETDGRCAPVTP
ncbi:hypothetical protein KKF05_03250 [Patescibacteria group bacterium]|nr:hypothetical protein [Patescibacteria group bacterium]MBU1028872.1 hypothetical protein [Patescibacteria group bacterium]MBU1915635.1 hypothetical protein [Patescibacteria group bacterium]